MTQQKKVKVLHVAQAAGGVDRYLRMLLKYTDKDKFENIVVFSQDYRQENYKMVVDTYETVEMKRTIGISDLKAVANVRKLIKNYEPDIVYAHSSKAGAIARIANIGMKNRCIYNPHGWAFNMCCSKIKRFAYAMIEKMAALFCDKIICISDAEKQSALRMKICKEDKLQVIYNGIDIEDYESKKHGALCRKQLGIPENAFVIGMVGRLSEQKAPDIFVKAAEQIKNKIENTYFLMVGNGELEQEIRHLADESGLENCLKITGWVDNPMEYIELFDVACLLSRWEGFGLVLPEYMLARKPIIATNVDAIPNIIRNEENGILVSVNNIEEIVDAVSKLHQNQELKNKLIVREVLDVRKYDARRMADESMRIYYRIIA